VRRVEGLLRLAELGEDELQKVFLGFAVKARAGFIEQDDDRVLALLVSVEGGEEREEPLEPGRSGFEVGNDAAMPLVPHQHFEDAVHDRRPVWVGPDFFKLGVEIDFEVAVLHPEVEDLASEIQG